MSSGGEGEIGGIHKTGERGGFGMRGVLGRERCGDVELEIGKKRGGKENPPGREGGDKGFKRKESDRIDGLGGEEINTFAKK